MGRSKHDPENGETGKILPISVRFRSSSRESFIQEYFQDVMQGGMFIRTSGEPTIKLGQRVRFCFHLADGQELFSGTGLVAWIQRKSEQQGLGIQFDQLPPESEELYMEMLKHKRKVTPKKQPRKLATSSGEFVETPTAPMDPNALLV